MKIKKIILLVAFSLTLLACSFTVNIPTIQTGDLQTLRIAEPLPESPESLVTVSMEMGAGNLALQGDGENLIEGEIIYNVPEWKPEISVTPDTIKLTQKTQGNNVGIPSKDLKNDWNIHLSPRVPLGLQIKAGAYTGKMDLGGLRLSSLEIADGASTNTIDFSRPNPEQLNLFTYKTGASTVTLNHLSNANFSKMIFEGGAGTYQLNFDGNLQRDGDVKITTGVSSLTLTIPQAIHAMIDISGGLKDVSTQGTWTVTDDVYETGPTDSPTISIHVEMGLGTLTLIQE